MESDGQGTGFPGADVLAAMAERLNQVWKVTDKELGFPIPSGYRVLEDVDVVVIVNPIGSQIFVGSATGCTREALQAAIEEDLTRRSRSGTDRVPHPDDHPPGAP